MARGNRLHGGGGIFHVTHRCHNRAFLLKFARDRDTYRGMVREHARKYRLNTCGIACAIARLPASFSNDLIEQQQFC
jgi:REP element-mobilizing transposase RayT